MHDPMEFAAMVRLWQGVLAAALREALHPDADEWDRAWIGSRDCRAVCELVGVDHARLVRAMAPRFDLVRQGRFVEAIDGLYDMDSRRSAAAARGAVLRARRAGVDA